MKLPLGTKQIAAVVVGAVDIFARTQDESKGTTGGKFLSTTADKARVGVTVLALIGNMVAKSGKMQQVTEGALLGAIPLLELSIYRATQSGGMIPFFLQQPRVQAVQGASYASSNPQGFVELAANGGIPIISTGVSVVNSGSGRLY